MRRRQGGFTLIEIMVVIAIIAGLVAAVSLGIPVVQERSRRLTCSQNLSDLGKLYQIWRMENPGKPKYSGTALFLHFRKKREIKLNEEEKLLCPGDQQVIFPKTDEDRAKWDEIDLTSIPTDMCSYAVRDFGNYVLEIDSGETQIIACDRNGDNGRTAHHKDGLNILFDNASSKFMDRESLGISPDQDIVVGPEADNKYLKQVIQAAERRE